MLDLTPLLKLFYLIMFSSAGLFNQIECPEQSGCFLPNCIFSHRSVAHKASSHRLHSPNAAHCIVGADDHASEAPRKKRRISKAGLNDPLDVIEPSSRTSREVSGGVIHTLPKTASREVSPPPLRNQRRSTQLASAPNGVSAVNKSAADQKPNGVSPSSREPAEVSLNPRMIHNPPASHAVRIQLITMLHEHMFRLNEEVKHSKDHDKSAMEFSSQELIANALAEEESLAKQNPAVYSNVMKLRIMRLKKMKLAEWREERIKQIERSASVKNPATAKIIPKPIETGLSTSEEIVFLSRLFAKQEGLANYGYVPKSPREEEVAQARSGAETAQGWEQCDRCKTRFQVFPGRRAEDGALTSGGQCVYHHAKPRRPFLKDKSDNVSRETMYSCCNQAVGVSVGCTTAATHVFKISDAKRLALVMPFKTTPPKSIIPGPKIAVCFDCEMGYTTLGLELIRLTATSWPKGEELLDVLVRPLGEIFDLNSRFSGVWPKDYTDALPYEENPTDTTNPSREIIDEKPKLRIVDSPAVARDLLFSLLTPSTPLIGHALDNDLNATRIIHPSIIDTVLLYRHPRGLPIRFGLKVLMKKHLDRDIQMGGAAGHDSKEDAQAAGDLVRLKVAEMWKTMKREGWTVRDDEFFPPVPAAVVW